MSQLLNDVAAIALKGPLSQTDLVELRGSGAYQHVQELVQQGFVRKRRQPETRSFSLQVTARFHQYFQLDQLPKQLELPFQQEQNLEGDEPDEFDETPEEFPEESPTE
jgi:segregation and condensation protein B